MVDILKFISDTNNARSEETLVNFYKEALASLGFDKFRYGFVTEHHSINKPIDHAIAFNFPEDWMKYYMEQGFIDLDPVKKQIPISRKPFDWDELDKHQKLTKKERDFMNLSKDAGLAKGVGLSVYTAYGEVAGFGLASEDKNLDINSKMLSLIQLLSVQFHNAYLEFHNVSNTVQEERVNLTPREKDVLTWIARGKSVGVIAEILAISENSVAYYLKNCYRKLNANTKILAVTKATYLGLIEPHGEIL